MIKSFIPPIDLPLAQTVVELGKGDVIIGIATKEEVPYIVMADCDETLKIGETPPEGYKMHPEVTVGLGNLESSEVLLRMVVIGRYFIKHKKLPSDEETTGIIKDITDRGY